MKFSDRFIRTQLELTKSLVDSSSLELTRNVQDRLGRLLRFAYRKETVVHPLDLNGIKGAMVVPRDEIRRAVILYLHGGGYTAGTLEYASGFASVLSGECNIRVAAVEYSLAPESPFPKAVDECVLAYRYLLDSGYPCENIVLAGESAGGGLCYAVCLRLKELSLPQPAGIIAISPWCDLTLSGESYETNKSRDPSLTKERLDFFASSYIGETCDIKNKPKKVKRKTPDAKSSELRKNPLVSPAFADLSGLSPSLIFAGGDEILLSDAETMSKRLSYYNVENKLVVRAGMWHAYHLYSLRSSKEDFDIINRFLKQVLPRDSQRKLRWMQLDNSAKIYPAAATNSWTNVFRLSASLKDDIDREILQSALDVTVRRFPSISVRLRRGVFWYYLEEIAHAPAPIDEKPYPLSRMSFKQIRKCAFRVLVYKNRIAVEFFHSLTDGSGGLTFLKSLISEYVYQRYDVSVPATHGVLDRLEEPSDSELEDSFFKHSGHVALSRREPNSYRIYGDTEEDGFRHITTFILDSQSIHKRAKALGVTVTAFLAAAIIKAGIALQNIDCPYERRQKPVKVLIPVDLRRLYGSNTLRNFALYTTPGIDTRLGKYTLEEIAKLVYHQMCMEINKNYMSAKIKTNVKDEENKLLKIVPLFLKNAVMRLVFLLFGERKSMLSLSNLGVVELPDTLKEYVRRLDFILSVQSNAPYNASAISYNGLTYLGITRNITEPRLERELYRVLSEDGIHVKLESNQR